MADVFKECRKCGKQKPLKQFPAVKGYRDGHRNTCKACEAVRARETYRRKHGEPKRKLNGPIRRAGEWDAIKKKGRQVCRSCGIEKALSKFGIHRSEGRVYFRKDCRDCRNQKARENRARNKERIQRNVKRYRCKQYGITVDDFERMLRVQKNKCAVCGKPLGEKRQTIDHDHDSGKVRGIVHSQCNLVLGNAREDVTVLLGAIDYLRKHHGNDQQQMRCLDKDTGKTVFLEIVA